MPAWQDITTAPKDRKIDLWAKCWRARTDTFEHKRFPDCRWDSGDSMCNRGPSWSGLPKEWHPTHWMDRPEAPASVSVERRPENRMLDCAEAFDSLASDYVKEGYSESASALQYAAGYIRDRVAEAD